MDRPEVWIAGAVAAAAVIHMVIGLFSAWRIRRKLPPDER